MPKPAFSGPIVIDFPGGNGTNLIIVKLTAMMGRVPDQPFTRERRREAEAAWKVPLGKTTPERL